MEYPKGIRLAKPPKRTAHFGRTWDSWTLLMMNGATSYAYLDTTWGTRFYFQGFDGQWRSGPIDDYKVEEGRSAFIDMREQRYGLKIDDEVELKDNPDAGRAKVKVFYNDIEGGIIVEPLLDGFRSWNVQDVRKVEAA